MSARDARRINSAVFCLICQAVTATLMGVMWLDGSSWAAPVVCPLAIMTIGFNVATIKRVLRRSAEERMKP